MKKKITALCICAALLAVAVIGGTLAFFTDYEDATNTFTVGDVDIILDEAPVVYNLETGLYEADDEATRVDTNEYKNIFPGAELPKDPTITNVGDYDAFVKVDITVPNVALEAFNAQSEVTPNMFDAFKSIVTGGDVMSATDYEWTDEYDMGAGFANDDYLLTYTVGDAATVFTVWTLKTVAAKDDGDTVFENITAVDDFTVFEKITVPSTCTNEDLVKLNGKFDMNIVATAIQAKGFADVEAAYAALAEETPTVEYGEKVETVVSE